MFIVLPWQVGHLFFGVVDTEFYVIAHMDSMLVEDTSHNNKLILLQEVTKMFSRDSFT